LFSSEAQRNIRQVESDQLVELHNREVQVLQAEKKLQRNYYLLGSLVLGLVALVIYSRLQTIRKTRRKLESMNAVLTTEKKRSDDLLLNILPMEVAEELKSNGSAAAKQYNNVSVLFTDFADFTGISEQMSPSELVAEIHRHFTAFDAIIEKHALEKIKTIGDAYMAVCGLPHETADHATRTVAAALEIRNYMRNAQSLFNVRIGIHSGAVVAGIVGIKKFAYDIWGDTVNTASRMESNSEIGKVNISSATYELVKDDFDCTQRGKIQVKGKGDIEMYFAEDKVTASIE
jgi:adenylate cyclase